MTFDSLALTHTINLNMVKLEYLHTPAREFVRLLGSAQLTRAFQADE